MTEHQNCFSCVKTKQTCHIYVPILGVSSSNEPNVTYTKCMSCGQEWIGEFPPFMVGSCMD